MSDEVDGPPTQAPAESQPPPLEAVLTMLAQGEDAAQVRAIVGDRPAARAAAQWEALVERSLGARVVGCCYHHVSVGITLELVLADGRRCVLKACGPGSAPEAWAEALRVQAHLHAQGFPAPAVLAPPRECGGAPVALVQALDRGEPVRWSAAVRDRLAREYARLVALAQGVEPRPALADGAPRPDRLWPPPHSVIFDFEATRAAAAAIDAVAAVAHARLLRAPADPPAEPPAEPPIIAHCDWSLQNVALRGGRLVGVFDWDSVRWVPEVLAVAGAAAFVMQDWRVGPEKVDHDFYPGPEPTLAFVDAYVRARGRPFTEPQRARLHAALVHRLAYQARCERALTPEREGPAEARLMRFATALGVR